MKLIKKLFAAALMFLLITSLALWVLSRSIKPEMLREYISGQLSHITAQKSQINGEMTWQLFPQPGIKINDIQVGDDQSSKEYSLHLNKLQLNLKIAPLLRGKLVFNDLAVKGFRLLIKSDASTAVSRTANSSKTQQSVNPFAEQIAIDRLMLSDGQAIIQSKDRQLIFNDLQIGAEDINLQAMLFPFQLKSNIVYLDHNNKIASTKIQFKGHTLLTSALLNDPLGQLKSAQLSGQLDVQNARSGQIKLGKLQANTRFKQGILQLNPLTINLYDGQSFGDFRYELAEKNIQLNQTASALNSAKLSHDLFGKTLLKGKLDMSLHIQTDLNQNNWQPSSLGNGNISIKDGSLEAIDLNRIIDASSQKINKMLTSIQPGLTLGTSANPLDEPMFFKGNTPFKLLSIPWRLENNSVHSEALLLQMDKLQVKGDSQLNLLDYALNGHLRATVLVDDKKINQIQTLLGGSFPLLIKNTVTEPRVVPDFSKISPVITKAWLNHTLTRPVRSLAEGVAAFLPK